MELSLLVLRCQDLDKRKIISENFDLVFQKQERRHGDGPEYYSCENNGIILELYPKTNESEKDYTQLGFIQG